MSICITSARTGTGPRSNSVSKVSGVGYTPRTIAWSVTCSISQI